MTWVVFDMHNWAWRFFHAWKDPTLDGLSEAMFQSIDNVATQFNSDQMVFCFDHGRSKRYDEYPEYKAGRKYPQVRMNHKRWFKEQADIRIEAIREQLEDAGFNNVCYAKGYEADDVIAKIADAIFKGKKDKAVIVSSDKDLYQCIYPNVDFYDPIKAKLVDMKILMGTWGIYPCDWWRVKALAGCRSDNIAGIDGVAEKTACKYLNNDLKLAASTRKYVQSQSDHYYEINEFLVRLPFPYCPSFDLVPDKNPQRKLRKML